MRKLVTYKTLTIADLIVFYIHKLNKQIQLSVAYKISNYDCLEYNEHSSVISGIFITVRAFGTRETISDITLSFVGHS